MGAEFIFSQEILRKILQRIKSWDYNRSWFLEKDDPFNWIPRRPESYDNDEVEFKRENDVLSTWKTLERTRARNQSIWNNEFGGVRAVSQWCWHKAGTGLNCIHCRYHPFDEEKEPDARYVRESRADAKERREKQAANQNHHLLQAGVTD